LGFLKLTHNINNYNNNIFDFYNFNNYNFSNYNNYLNDINNNYQYFNQLNNYNYLSNINANINNNNNKLETTSFEIKFLTPIEEYKDKYERYKKKVEEVHNDDLILNILVWNCQRINKKFTRRDLKIKFIKDVLNFNKVDIIYLIDVGNFSNNITLNGYTRYDDNRNVLFVINEIKNEFMVDKKNMFIKSDECKLGFIYVTPNSKNEEQFNIIKNPVYKNYHIFGDFNLDSNCLKLAGEIVNFNGEDTLRCGLINKKPIKCRAVDGPSDHYALLYIINSRIRHQFPLRLKEISVQDSIETVKKILNGNTEINFQPKITVKQFKQKFNDSEELLNKMIYNYIDNNVSMAYRKYNYLWKFMRKEPFLGTHVNQGVISTFAKHLHADIHKEYEDCIISNVPEYVYIEADNKIIPTKSSALTQEYISLSSVFKGVKEYMTFSALKKMQQKQEMKDYNVINNVLKICNNYKNHLRANTFFLVKNSKLEDFNDVRMIIIIPTFIKIYELLIYQDVCNYINKEVNGENETKYQYGGLHGGSCFYAIYALRQKYVNNKGRGLLVTDMTKGYDSVNLQKLKEIFLEIQDVRIKLFLLNWLILVKNMDYNMDNQVIKRQRGIGMGLSLSPAIFVYYVNHCFKGLNKENFIMYIDDLTIVIPESMRPIEAFDLVNTIISRLHEYDLVINKQKSVMVTRDRDFAEAFKSEYCIIQEDRFLGRELALNDAGFLVGDDRFYNAKQLTLSSFPNYNIAGIQNLIINGAILARLRYRFMCWSTNSAMIKKKIFTNNWIIFKSKNQQFSYIQMLLAMPNVFAFFMDALEINLLTQDMEEKKVNKDEANKLIKDKLKTGVETIDKAIDKIEIEVKVYSKEIIENGKLLMDDIFTRIKKAAIINYKEEKQQAGIQVFNDLDYCIRSRLYKNFRLIQNLVWLHFWLSKNKTLLTIEILGFVKKWIQKTIDWKEDKCEVKESDWGDIFFDELEVPEEVDDEQIWSNFIKIQYMQYWDLLKELFKIEKLVDKIKNYNTPIHLFYKKLFKILTATECVINNNNFSDMNLLTLEYLFKIKLYNLDPWLDGYYNLIIHNSQDNVEVCDIPMDF